MVKITKQEICGKAAEKMDKYRVTNWSSYNKSLVGRGDITIWIEEEAVSNWYHEGPDQRGGTVRVFRRLYREPFTAKGSVQATVQAVTGLCDVRRGQDNGF